MSQSDLKKILSEGLHQLNLSQTLGDKQQDTLIKYVELLNKWNKAYNLTAVRKPEQMVVRHLLDSLSISPFIQGEKILDVGTGAGLPGIPLAILYPERHFTLLDSNSKKTRFVVQASSELELPNVDVVQSRVEEFQSADGFDTVVTRAYSAVGNMVEQTSHLVLDDGVFLAMKGVNPITEIEELAANYIVKENHVIAVPGLEEERHLLEIKVKKE